MAKFKLPGKSVLKTTRVKGINYNYQPEICIFSETPVCLMKV